MISGTVTLKNGAWQADILPAKGANPVKLTCNGKNVFRPLEDIEALKSNPFLWGSPILIPANRTDGAKFNFDGTEYTIPLNEPKLGNNLHGMMYDLEFKTELLSESSARSVYENKGEAYPFPFRITVDVAVSEEGFSRRFEITNTGSGDMPLTFALHTTFAIEKGELLQVPLARAHRRNERLIPLYYGDLNEKEEKVAAGTDPYGMPIVGYFLSGGHKAVIGDFEYSVSENFDHWIVYNGDGVSGWVCVEPQAGRVNGLNDGGFIRLAPGESSVFTTCVSRRNG